VTRLDDLKWTPRWVSHMGCLKGCLDYLGLRVTDAWLYGATGHAFVINIADGVCPSGPTAWNTKMLFELGKNLGYAIECVWGTKQGGDLARAQQNGWDLARRTIGDGLPCYGWELDVPEYYVVHGYDDRGYHYSGPGCDDGAGPKPWRELGDTEIGCFEMNAVRPGRGVDVATVVRDALTFALEVGGGSDRWTFPNYHAGLSGYDAWIQAFETGVASRFGAGYNAAVWAECRRYAAGFLKEAGERTDAKHRSLFADAVSCYQKVHAALAEVSKIYPFCHDHEAERVAVDAKSAAAARALRDAREAEEAGLATLGRIVDAIGS